MKFSKLTLGKVKSPSILYEGQDDKSIGILIRPLHAGIESIQTITCTYEELGTVMKEAGEDWKSNTYFMPGICKNKSEIIKHTNNKEGIIFHPVLWDITDKFVYPKEGFIVFDFTVKPLPELHKYVKFMNYIFQYEVPFLMVQSFLKQRYFLLVPYKGKLTDEYLKYLYARSLRYNTYGLKPIIEHFDAAGVPIVRCVYNYKGFYPWFHFGLGVKKPHAGRYDPLYINEGNDILTIPKKFNFFFETCHALKRLSGAISGIESKANDTTIRLRKNTKKLLESLNVNVEYNDDIVNTLATGDIFERTPVIMGDDYLEAVAFLTNRKPISFLKSDIPFIKDNKIAHLGGSLFFNTMTNEEAYLRMNSNTLIWAIESGYITDYNDIVRSVYPTTVNKEKIGTYLSKRFSIPRSVILHDIRKYSHDKARIDDYLDVSKTNYAPVLREDSVLPLFEAEGVYCNELIYWYDSLYGIYRSMNHTEMRDAFRRLIRNATLYKGTNYIDYLSTDRNTTLLKIKEMAKLVEDNSFFDTGESYLVFSGTKRTEHFALKVDKYGNLTKEPISPLIRKRYYISQMWDYIPNAKPKQFLKSLQKRLDEEQIEILRYGLGAALFNRLYALQHMLVLYGPGNAGKSNILKIFGSLIDDSGITNANFAKMSSRLKAINSLAKASIMVDIDYNFLSPLPYDKVFKKAIVGEPISGARGRIVYPRISFVCATNGWITTGQDWLHASRRRFAYIVFDEQIPDKDKIIDYDRKIKGEELSEFGSWLIDGYCELVKKGITDLRYSKKALELEDKMLKGMNSISTFLNDTDVVMPIKGKRVRRLDLWYAYNNYIKMAVMTPMDKQEFEKLVSEKFEIAEKDGIVWVIDVAIIG